MRVAYAGGDGVEVDGVTNITIDRVTSDHNYRQGMSIAGDGTDGLLVIDSLFALTNGTAPMAGEH